MPDTTPAADAVRLAALRRMDHAARLRSWAGAWCPARRTRRADDRLEGRSEAEFARSPAGRRIPGLKLVEVKPILS